MKTYNQYLTEGEKEVTLDKALELSSRYKVDLNKYSIKEFKIGLGVEMEHADVIGQDESILVKIVLAHLDENPEYYKKLKAAGL